MQTRALETLVKIHQINSFTRAADLLNMTLSALSMQMKALELELNTVLFDRTVRPPRLTPIGRKIAGQAKHVIEAQKILQDICNPSDRLTGYFRIGFIPSANVRLLPAFLKNVQHNAPLASFDLSSGLSENLVEQVMLGQLDAAVVTRVQGSMSGLEFDVITTEDMAVTTPLEHANIALSDLPATLPFIHFMPRTGIGKLIAQSFRDMGTKPKRTIVIDSIETAMECVKQGLGYTILPRLDIERYGADRVYIYPSGPEVMRREIVLVAKSDTGTQKWLPLLAAILKQAA